MRPATRSATGSIARDQENARASAGRWPTSGERVSLAGAATAEGTRRYAERFADRFADDFYRELGDALLGASIGLGTYLGSCDDADDASYRAAVLAALAGGCNLLDSAINYRCQHSERAVGRALADAVAAGTAARDEVIVCSKGGYVPLDDTPPASREAYEEYLRREFYDEGVMTPADVVAGGHCLTPGFLAHQVARSRANLGVDTIDVYYVHNPEQQLEVIDRGRFRQVLRRAFQALEERVAAGEIGCYGVATWAGLRTPPGTRTHLSLVELVELAREVAGDQHHLAVVQLPLNLALTEAVRLPTQPLPPNALVPLLQAAADLGVCVVASATLMQAQLAAGLPPQLRDAFPGHETDAQRAIAFVRALPGICAGLVGMRSAAHVEENLRSARRV
jgi:aryl-alcohol dehydrogenase-like predicted oxidoreductase